MKILIVDDTRLSRNMLQKKIPDEIKASAEIIQGTNGEEAVKLYKEHNPDVVFLDLTMPVMNGFDALALIRSMDKNARVYVVTADIQASSRERVMKLGAMALEPKPIKEERMIEIFSDLTGKI